MEILLLSSLKVNENMTVLIYIAVALIIFLIFREVVTWYWKINKIVSLLEKIEENTRAPELKKELEPQSAGSVWRDGKWVAE